MTEQDFFGALDHFARYYVGEMIRGQFVEHVEFTADTLGIDQKKKWHYILTVVFKTNPSPPDASKERRLLDRVFSEIPDHAFVVTQDLNEAIGWMKDEVYLPDHRWKLSDEIGD